MITIPLGWWLAPLITTLAACAWAVYGEHSARTPTLGTAIVGLFYWAVAVVVSLLAWIVWAILT